MTQLETVTEELKQATKRAVEIGRRLPADDFVKPPAPKRWSPAECIEHLNLTSKAFLARIEPGVRELRETSQHSPGRYRLEWKARVLRWLLEPPARMRIPTPAAFQPVQLDNPARVIDDFVGLQDRLLEQIRLADGLALDRYLIASPFSENVKYNLYAAFVLIAVHERRHLWQAARAGALE